MSASPVGGAGLVERRVHVPVGEVAWVRYVLEAHDGLAFFYSAGGGELTLVAPEARARELDDLIDDLAAEIPLTRAD
ncbi:MAG: DUF4911 domain-containing protein [Sandaracinaceae bacterium]|nr:DUF4911 domain-containing protein [Sandaracinaceae bacterium]